MTSSDGKEYALWPEHMSLETLKAMRDNPKHPRYIGSIAFAQEYQNKPLDEGDMTKYSGRRSDQTKHEWLPEQWQLTLLCLNGRLLTQLVS